MKQKLVWFLWWSWLALVACGRQADQSGDDVPVVQETAVAETATIEVTRLVMATVVAETAEIPPPPETPSTLVICQPSEPESLYWYRDRSEAATAVYHAIYENSFTHLSFAYQAQALTKLPSLQDGDAVLNIVDVQEGDTVVAANGNVTTLQVGTAVINADGEAETFIGEPIAMPQLVVTFQMKPTVWADGQPVQADDSVYSYELASDPNTPGDKFLVARTAVYEAVDELSTRWTGIPGFWDTTYFTNFRRPLPRHAWGVMTAMELLEADTANQMPLGDGPFRVVEWEAGDYIRLERNPNYYRADEELPKVEELRFRFIPDTNQLVAQLLSGRCDIVTHEGLDVAQTPFFLEAETNSMLNAHFAIGTVWEHLDFAINPESRYGSTRPDWFEDVRVRQAIAMCIDRQGLVDEIMFGRSEVMQTYMPAVHPLFAGAELQQWPHDVAAAKALLDEVGYVDVNEDGLREFGDAPFIVTLHTTTGNEMRQRVAQQIQQDLRDCGIELNIVYLPAEALFANGPNGPLFGRQFDLALFGWPVEATPACEFYLSSQIPSSENNWGGENETGWSNEEFDIACLSALRFLPGTAEYDTFHHEAQRIFAEQLPVIPLFPRLKVAITRPDVCNFGLDPTQLSELYNLFEMGLGDCE